MIERVDGATVRVSLTRAVWVGDPLSLACAVKLKVPLAEGVPEITPVEDRLMPAGRLPETTDHV